MHGLSEPVPCVAQPGHGLRARVPRFGCRAHQISCGALRPMAGVETTDNPHVYLCLTPEQIARLNGEVLRNLARLLAVRDRRFEP